MKNVILNGEEIKEICIDKIKKDNVKRIKFISNEINFIIDFNIKGTIHEIKTIKVNIHDCKFEYDIMDDFLQDFYINDNGYFIYDKERQEICLLLEPEFADKNNIKSFLYYSNNFKFRIFRG